MQARWTIGLDGRAVAIHKGYALTAQPCGRWLVIEMKAAMRWRDDVVRSLFGRIRRKIGIVDPSWLYNAQTEAVSFVAGRLSGRQQRLRAMGGSKC